MQINRVGIRISIFCAAFLLGFSAVEYLVSSNTEERVVQQTIVEFVQPQVEQEANVPPCREFVGDLNADKSLVEDSSKGVLIPKALKSSHRKSETRKADEKKFSNIEREFQELDRIMKDAQEREQGSTHTLLYVANCAEYNESR